jgi:vancomycin resistance protein YoaR
LIQTETDEKAGTLTFDFYGVSAGREVIVSKPVSENVVPHGGPIYEETSDLEPGEVKQVDWAVDGVDVTVTRTVKEGDQIIHQDTIFSRYRPWQAVYRVGADRS